MTVSFRPSILKAMERKEVVLTYVENVITGKLTKFDVEEIEAWTDYFSDFVEPGVDPSEPLSDLLYPLVDELDSIVLDPSAAGQSSVGASKSLLLECTHLFLCHADLTVFAHLQWGC